MTKRKFDFPALFILALQLGAQTTSVPQAQQPLQSMAIKANANAYSGLEVQVLRDSFIGKHLCDTVADNRAVVDSYATSLDDKHTALAFRWPDANPALRPRSAIVTIDGSCIATEGSVIDGKRIVMTLPASLAITNQGVVLFEAFYTSDASSPTLHRGVFAGDRLALELDLKKASQPDSWPEPPEQKDFTWDEARNSIARRQGVGLSPTLAVLPAQPQPIAPPANPKPGQSPAPKTPNLPCSVLNGQQKPGKPSLLPKSIQDRLKQLKDQFPGACPSTGTQAQ